MKSALGQRNVQRLGCRDGVIEEHLVEVAHPVEQQRARVLRLDLQILRHHRRDGFFAHLVLLDAPQTLQKPARGEKRQSSPYAEAPAGGMSDHLADRMAP